MVALTGCRENMEYIKHIAHTTMACNTSQNKNN